MDQQHEQNPSHDSSLFQMNLDAQNSYHLRTAASWAKVLGVVGIILGLLFLYAGIAIYVKIENGGYESLYEGLYGAYGSRMGIWMVILVGIIFILGAIFSYSFGNRMNAALKTNTQEGLNRGFVSLRNYFALRAIVLIVLLLLMLLGIAGSI